MYYLMIKTHIKTGVKYLCQTKRKNPYAYIGSGKYWKLHIKEHGPLIHTQILGEYENKNELINAGIYYSNLYNVVESNEWANLKIEEGDGGDTSNTLGFMEGMKQRRSYSGEGNPNYGKVGSWAGKVGPMIGKKWCNNGVSEKLTDKIPEGWIEGRIKKQCEYCDKFFNDINYKRWHGNNCKYKTLINE